MASSYVDSIMRDCSLDEVRTIYKQSLESQEAKKMELSLVVGARYKELISSSDQCVTMLNLSKKLSALMDGLPSLYQDVLSSLPSSTSSACSPSLSPTTPSPLPSSPPLLPPTPSSLLSLLHSLPSTIILQSSVPNPSLPSAFNSFLSSCRIVLLLCDLLDVPDSPPPTTTTTTTTATKGAASPFRRMREESSSYLSRVSDLLRKSGHVPPPSLSDDSFTIAPTTKHPARADLLLAMGGGDYSGTTKAERGKMLYEARLIWSGLRNLPSHLLSSATAFLSSPLPSSSSSSDLRDTKAALLILWSLDLSSPPSPSSSLLPSLYHARLQALQLCLRSSSSSEGVGGSTARSSVGVGDDDDEPARGRGEGGRGMESILDGVLIVKGAVEDAAGIFDKGDDDEDCDDDVPGMLSALCEGLDDGIFRSASSGSRLLQYPLARSQPNRDAPSVASSASSRKANFKREGESFLSRAGRLLSRAATEALGKSANGDALKAGGRRGGEHADAAEDKAPLTPREFDDVRRRLQAACCCGSGKAQDALEIILDGQSSSSSSSSLASSSSTGSRPNGGGSNSSSNNNVLYYKLFSKAVAATLDVLLKTYVHDDLARQLERVASLAEGLEQEIADDGDEEEYKSKLTEGGGREGGKQSGREIVRVANAARTNVTPTDTIARQAREAERRIAHCVGSVRAAFLHKLPAASSSPSAPSARAAAAEEEEDDEEGRRAVEEVELTLQQVVAQGVGDLCIGLRRLACRLRADGGRRQSGARHGARAGANAKLLVMRVAINLTNKVSPIAHALRRLPLRPGGVPVGRSGGGNSRGVTYSSLRSAFDVADGSCSGRLNAADVKAALKSLAVVDGGTGDHLYDDVDGVDGRDPREAGGVQEGRRLERLVQGKSMDGSAEGWQTDVVARVGNAPGDDVSFDELLLVSSRWLDLSTGSSSWSGAASQERMEVPTFFDAARSALDGVFKIAFDDWFDDVVAAPRAMLMKHVLAMRDFTAAVPHKNADDFERVFGAVEDEQQKAHGGLESEGGTHPASSATDLLQLRAVSPQLLLLLHRIAAELNGCLIPADIVGGVTSIGGGEGKGDFFSRCRKHAKRKVLELVHECYKVAERTGAGTDMLDRAKLQVVLDVSFAVYCIEETGLGDTETPLSELLKLKDIADGMRARIAEKDAARSKESIVADIITDTYSRASALLDTVFWAKGRRLPSPGSNADLKPPPSVLTCLNSSARFELFALPVDEAETADAPRNKAGATKKGGARLQDAEDKGGGSRESVDTGVGVGGLLKSFWS